MTFERVVGAWNPPSRRDNRSNCATIQERNNELPVGALRRETSDNALIVSRRLHKDARGSCKYRSLLRLCNSTNYRHDPGPRYHLMIARNNFIGDILRLHRRQVVISSYRQPSRFTRQMKRKPYVDEKRSRKDVGASGIMDLTP
ncbi:hypothetical protein V1478_008705 [Vespula squamosa]|uniref:Uncharacterized protein n=1 Tax=Vespula squamosa TaxID=30214 RepID=A0ABD2AV55_VESSQ